MCVCVCSCTVLLKKRKIESLAMGQAFKTLCQNVCTVAWFHPSTHTPTFRRDTLCINMEFPVILRLYVFSAMKRNFIAVVNILGSSLPLTTQTWQLLYDDKHVCETVSGVMLYYNESTGIDWPQIFIWCSSVPVVQRSLYQVISSLPVVNYRNNQTIYLLAMSNYKVRKNIQKCYTAIWKR